MHRPALTLLLLALAARAELLVSSFHTGQVLAFDPATGAHLASWSDPALDAPHQVAFAFDVHLYVTSANLDRILRCDPAGGPAIGALATNGVPLDYPAGLALGPDGLLYASSQLSDAVLRYQPTNGAFVDTFVTAGSGGLDGPSGLTFGPDGHLYVVGRYSQRVHRYDGATGASLGPFVTNRLSQPFGLCFGPDGQLYVANGNSNHVARFDGNSGTFLDIFASGGGLSLPIGLAFGPDTNLYVANFGGDTVARFDGTTGAFMGNVMAAGAGGLSGPNFLTFRPEPRAAPITEVALAAESGLPHLTLRVPRGTNTGPVRAWAERTDNLRDGPWLGGTNVVVLEDSAQVFRARDAEPASAAPARYLRVRFAAP